MSGTRLRNHVLVVASALVVAGLLGAHLGVNYGQWWLLTSVVVVLHIGVLGALVAYVVRRVRRLRATRPRTVDVER